MTSFLKPTRLAALTGLLTLCAFSTAPATADPYRWCAVPGRHQRSRDELLFHDTGAVPGDNFRRRRLLHAELSLHRPGGDSGRRLAPQPQSRHALMP